MKNSERNTLPEPETRLRVISSDWQGSNYEGEKFEDAVNDFCNGREIINIRFEFNPAINVRHLAYIIYKEQVYYEGVKNKK